MKKRMYIAYGSNLNRGQMANRCPGAKIIAKSRIHDYRLVFQGSPQNAHANVIPANGYDVPVVIWEIDRYDEMSLDRYEGVRGGYYRKETMSIEVNGKTEEALIYIMSPNPYGTPADIYLDIIAEGYADFNFDFRILNDALRASQQRRIS